MYMQVLTYLLIWEEELIHGNKPLRSVCIILIKRDNQRK